MELHISELEQDIIREVINLSLAKTADSFAMIARQQVLLHVPDVRIIEPAEIRSTLHLNGNRSTVVIQSDIKDELEGKTFVVFYEEQAKHLAEICIGPESHYQGNYAAMKRSLLLEVSNILTGSLVTQLANIFNLHIYGTPPMAVPLSLRRSFHDLVSDFPVFKPFILTVHTQFHNREGIVEMPILIVLDMSSTEKLLGIIRHRSKQNPAWLFSA